MPANVEIDGERLWQSLMEMARIGETPRGGVCRLTLTDLDREARDLLRRWCEAIGCTVRVDPMGNLFARREGRDPGLPPVGTGSHLDTQPTGGKFDGALGVLAGLEVLRTLAERGIETEAPVELAMWTNEEGARFAPAMLGSGVWAGVFDLDYGLGRTDHEGLRFGDELERIGYRGEAPLGHPYRAFFELHIEQGPILEAEGATIGVVRGVQGIRWYDVRVTGAESHAGPTPMDLRRDALVAAAALVGEVRALARAAGSEGRGTVGELHLSPGSRNTVPGRVALSVDLRHPEAARLAEMDAALRRAAAQVAAQHRADVEVDEIWHSPPVEFDPACVEAVRRGAARLGHPARDIVSGAGHDSVYVSRIAPTSMIFIPCEGGVSHNETEAATPADVAAGANVLLHAILERAGA